MQIWSAIAYILPEMTSKKVHFHSSMLCKFMNHAFMRHAWLVFYFMWLFLLLFLLQNRRHLSNGVEIRICFQPMALEQVLSDRDSEDEVDDDIADFEDRRVWSGDQFWCYFCVFFSLLRLQTQFVPANFDHLKAVILILLFIPFIDARWFRWCDQRWEEDHAFVEFICSETEVPTFGRTAHFPVVSPYPFAVTYDFPCFYCMILVTSQLGDLFPCINRDPVTHSFIKYCSA